MFGKNRKIIALLEKRVELLEEKVKVLEVFHHEKVEDAQAHLSVCDVLLKVLNKPDSLFQDNTDQTEPLNQD